MYSFMMLCSILLALFTADWLFIFSSFTHWLLGELTPLLLPVLAVNKRQEVSSGSLLSTQPLYSEHTQKASKVLNKSNVDWSHMVWRNSSWFNAATFSDSNEKSVNRNISFQDSESPFVELTSFIICEPLFSHSFSVLPNFAHIA